MQAEIYRVFRWNHLETADALVAARGQRLTVPTLWSRGAKLETHVRRCRIRHPVLEN